MPDLCIMLGKRARRGYYVTTYTSLDWWFLERVCVLLGLRIEFYEAWENLFSSSILYIFALWY